LPAGDGTLVAVRAVGQCFALALKLASPFLLAAIVWHVVLGLLGRLVPQLQVYFVALPGQLLGGLLLLAILVGAIITTWQGAVSAGFARLPGLP
jgi:flagellar biosynthetic protein FliR